MHLTKDPSCLSPSIFVCSCCLLLTETLLGRQNEQSHADPQLSILELHSDSAVINCEIFGQRAFTSFQPSHIAKLTQLSTEHRQQEQ